MSKEQFANLVFSKDFKNTPELKPEPTPQPTTTGAELTGEISPAYATISSTGYTGNKYFATRRRLAYHPPDKQFTARASKTTTAPPAPEPIPESVDEESIRDRAKKIWDQLHALLKKDSRLEPPEFYDTEMPQRHLCIVRSEPRLDFSKEDNSKKIIKEILLVDDLHPETLPSIGSKGKMVETKFLQGQYVNISILDLPLDADEDNKILLSAIGDNLGTCVSELEAYMTVLVRATHYQCMVGSKPPSEILEMMLKMFPEFNVRSFVWDGTAYKILKNSRAMSEYHDLVNHVQLLHDVSSVERQQYLDSIGVNVGIMSVVVGIMAVVVGIVSLAGLLKDYHLELIYMVIILGVVAAVGVIMLSIIYRHLKKGVDRIDLPERKTKSQD